MKKIKLSNVNKYTIIDDDMYEYLKDYNWYMQTCGYACARKKIDGEWIAWLMHRAIMNTPKGMCTDHINHNKLDNRKSNLRICTHTENSRNNSTTRGRSKYKGVYYSHGKWCAQIVVNGKKIRPKRFDSEKDAAEAYNKMAIELFGQFAHINKTKETKSDN